MFREWENLSIFEKALDLIFNIILGLNRVHVGIDEFKKDRNRKYETMDIQWKYTSEEGKKVLKIIH